jgi:hypothetical protein
MTLNRDRNKSRWHFLTLTLAAVIFLSADCPARGAVEDANLVRLTLKVTNGTTNGKPVLADKITLTSYQHEKLVDTLTGQVGPQGAADFNNVRADEHMVAVATVFHQGMSFSSGDIPLLPGRKQVTANVTVFDVSYDISRLSVATQHLIIKPRDSDILLTEFIQLLNPSDMAITSDRKDAQGKAIVLNMLLPAGFENFNASGFLVPQALVFTPDGFYDTMGIPPGNHQIVFSYTLDIDARAIDVTRTLSLPTANFVLFWQPGHGKIEGLGDADGKMVMTDGTMGEYYNLGSLQAGAEVRFQISGLRTAASDKTSWMILAAVFAAIAVLVFVRLRLTKSRSPERNS